MGCLGGHEGIDAPRINIQISRVYLHPPAPPPQQIIKWNRPLLICGRAPSVYALGAFRGQLHDEEDKQFPFPLTQGTHSPCVLIWRWGKRPPGGLATARRCPTLAPRMSEKNFAAIYLSQSPPLGFWVAHFSLWIRNVGKARFIDIWGSLLAIGYFAGSRIPGGAPSPC